MASTKRKLGLLSNHSYDGAEFLLSPTLLRSSRPIVHQIQSTSNFMQPSQQTVDPLETKANKYLKPIGRSDTPLIHNALEGYQELIDEEANSLTNSDDFSLGSEDGKIKQIVDLLANDAISEHGLSNCREYLLQQPIEFERTHWDSAGVQINQRIICAPGNVLEFRDGSFMLIETLIRDDAGQTFLKGQMFICQDKRGPQLPQRYGEVIWMQTQSLALARKKLVQQDIVRNRFIYKTNELWPRFSAQTYKEVPPLQDCGSVSDPLFCRWKCIQHLRRGRVVGEDFITLTEEESHPEGKINRDDLRTIHRGVSTAAGGSHRELRRVHDIDSEEDVLLTVSKYTLGDGFCGAGGVTCGAIRAGLQVQWSFDRCATALDTYRKNFPTVNVLHQDAFTFFQQEAESQHGKVDILHVSPPCQAYSPANTTTSTEQGLARNEENRQTLLVVPDLVGRIRPRVMTIEQTPGLVTRHKEWFHSLLNGLVSHGYSYRWRFLQCSDYGVPQSRQRLVLFASCQGETCPTIPDPTHGPSSQSRRPRVMINNAIAGIDPTVTDHDIDDALYPEHFRRVSFDGNTLAKTVTTSGGFGNWHPCGFRNYTIREYARLQRFPDDFLLAEGTKSAKKTQIGNAVPPLLAEVLFKHIVKWLHRRDSINRRTRQGQGAGSVASKQHQYLGTNVQ